MRISDWSSDVCSSDLNPGEIEARRAEAANAGDFGADGGEDAAPLRHVAMAHEGNAGRDQAFVEAAARRNAQAAVVQPRTAAALGPIAFVGTGLLDQRSGDVTPPAAALRLLPRPTNPERVGWGK